MAEAAAAAVVVVCTAAADEANEGRDDVLLFTNSDEFTVPHGGDSGWFP